MGKLFTFIRQLTLDWGSLVAIITGGLTIAFFIFNLVSVNNLQAEQIKDVTVDVISLKQAIPYIERSLGRIEGKLGIYDHAR